MPNVQKYEGKVRKEKMTPLKISQTQMNSFVQLIMCISLGYDPDALCFVPVDNRCQVVNGTQNLEFKTARKIKVP